MCTISQQAGKAEPDGDPGWSEAVGSAPESRAVLRESVRLGGSGAERNVEDELLCVAEPPLESECSSSPRPHLGPAESQAWTAASTAPAPERLLLQRKALALFSPRRRRAAGERWGPPGTLRSLKSSCVSYVQTGVWAGWAGLSEAGTLPLFLPAESLS
ncbi:hypothetical protein MHYP_G00241040 [Metynnis hypsauchen]